MQGEVRGANLFDVKNSSKSGRRILKGGFRCLRAAASLRGWTALGTKSPGPFWGVQRAENHSVVYTILEGYVILGMTYTGR